MTDLLRWADDHARRARSGRQLGPFNMPITRNERIAYWNAAFAEATFLGAVAIRKRNKELLRTSLRNMHLARARLAAHGWRLP